MTTYLDFLKQKIVRTQSYGFNVQARSISDILLRHQRDIVRWAIAGGRRGIFASFGLGKTLIQLEICRLIKKREGGIWY